MAASLQDLYKLLTAWQQQQRKNDNATPFERDGPSGKAGVPFAKVGIPGAPSSVTVPIVPFNGIGDMLDTPGIAPEEGTVGNADAVERSLNEMPSQGYGRLARQFSRARPMQDVRADSLSGRKYGEPEAPNPTKYNPFQEEEEPRKLTPPVLTPQAPASAVDPEQAAALAEQPDAAFVNTLGSTYSPNLTPPDQQSTQAPPKEERGFFDRVTRNPLFLTSAGVMANSMKSPLEALGIGALGAAQQYQSNRRFDDQLARQDRRLDIEDKRYTSQDAYNRERNSLTDKRLEREFTYRQGQDALAQRKLDALQRHQELTRTVAIQQQVEKEIESQRKFIEESGDKKAIEAFRKNVPVIRRQLMQEKVVANRLMTPGAGISFQDFAAGPGGILNLR